MGENSKIEWTEATWNPTVGCTMVSPGCAHCYAQTMAHHAAIHGDRCPVVFRIKNFLKGAPPHDADAG